MEPKYLGGQAVIEGVLIRNGNRVATAVRKKDGTIVLNAEKIDDPKYHFFKWPMFRGVFTLVQTMGVGMRALQYSAKEAMDEEQKVGKAGMAFSIILSVAFALVIFKLIPLLVAEFISKKAALNVFSFNAIEGLVKASLFIGYIALIAKMDDIKRVFMYHGAEHKVVNCYEKERKVSIKLAKKHSRIHKRCGTSFVLFVIFLSILIYLFIPLNFSLPIKFSLRILFLPLIAGLAYEILKLSSKYDSSKALTLIISPGLLLQRLTTEEPSDDQLEVAIHALKEALKEQP
ncbi:DUF1385 domain-containing protein [Candidatus Woesearchaeota archaeon]|nr:DUF1385 domain-containing protein [Candidatus Woesearchaeota archaeon]